MNRLRRRPHDSEELARALTRVNRRLRRERQSDLSASQLSLMGMLREHGPGTPSDLAKGECVSAPSITRMLKGLTERGLVTKTAHPHDGRQVLISLSTEGETTLDVERRRRDAWLHEEIAQLDARERAVLREASSILNRLADA